MYKKLSCTQMKIKCTKIDMILTQKFNWLETC